MENTFSYWEKESFFNFDAIIIGSGIVGLNAAIELKKLKPILKIAVLDAGFLPTGASTKNAGFACFGSISELIEQEKLLGTDALYSLVKKRWEGLKRLRNNLGDSSIDYQNNGGFELFKKEEKISAQYAINNIEYYNSLIKDITQESCSFTINDAKIKQFGFSNIISLIENKCESSIDTGKMMFQLVRLATENGITIFNSCKVEQLHSEHNISSIITNQGLFKAKKILVCTNAFSKTLIPDLEIEPGRGQVIITKPIHNLKLKGTFHYDKGFYYFRDINNRVLLGGGRNLDFNTEKTTDFGTTPLIINDLNNLLENTILPNTKFEIDYTWSGIMAFGSGLEPIIKQLDSNLFCAVRCSGMGVAIGSQTGTDLANLVYETF